MQVPLLSGIGASTTAEFVASSPVNLEPLPIDSKISKGQLRMAAGAKPFGTGPGTDRGGIAWKGQCYRVMGTKLVLVSSSGQATTLGDVGGSGPVSMDYSFDRLAIRSGTALYYWDGSTLSQVSDVDLGPVIDMLWIDGYFMTTDGTHVVVTELADPTAVNPLKYGSAEQDPDPVTGLIKVGGARDEAYVCGENTIQVFKNVGGNGFPFATVKGATVPVGCVGPAAKCLFGGSFAFVGSGRGEALAVYVAGDGSATQISPRALDDALAAVEDPPAISLERRKSRAEERLFVHLPGESWVFLLKASAAVGEPIWYRVRSGFGGAYRPRNAVFAYGKMLVGDTQSGAIGELADDVAAHFGEVTEWQFDAGLLYGQGKGGIVHSIELVGLPGRGREESAAFLSLTRDGETFGPERAIVTKQGDRRKRLQWRPGARFPSYLGLRFRGYGGMPGFAAIEADVRGLAA